MVGQHCNGYLFIHLIYCIKQGAQHSLVEVFDSAFFQHCVTFVSGLVARLYVEEYEIGISFESVNGSLYLALVVGVGKTCGTGDYDRGKTGVHSYATDEIYG